MRQTRALLKEPWLWLTLAAVVAILARDAEGTVQTYLLALAAAAGVAGAGVVVTRILDQLEDLRTEEVRVQLRRTEEERDDSRGQLRRAEEQLLELGASLKELRLKADELTKVAEILSVEDAEDLKDRGVSRIFATRQRARHRIAEIVMTQADTKLGEIQVVAVAGRELLYRDKAIDYEGIPLVEALRDRLIDPDNHTALWVGLLKPENCDEAQRRDFLEGENHETIDEIKISRNNFLRNFGDLIKSNRAHLGFYAKRPSMLGIHTPHAAFVQHYAEAPQRLKNPPDPEHPWAEGCYGDVYPPVELRPGTPLYDTFTEEIRRIREDDCEHECGHGEKPLCRWKAPPSHQ